MQAERNIELVGKIHQQLKIPADYAQARSLILYPEARQLVIQFNDIDERTFYLDPDCALSWIAMKAKASDDGITLKAYSGFRTYEYQRDLIKRRLSQGADIAEVLTYLAAPGYSEHHCGCALDLTTENSKPGSEDFERTSAFEWLSEHAESFNFFLSYPRDNKWGFVYEPWHWAYRKKGLQTF